MNFENKRQGFKKCHAWLITKTANFQMLVSCIFGTTKPILLKLVSFCSEWSPLWADKFSSKSMTSGDIFWFFVLLAKNDPIMIFLQTDDHVK